MYNEGKNIAEYNVKIINLGYLCSSSFNCYDKYVIKTKEMVQFFHIHKVRGLHYRQLGILIIILVYSFSLIFLYGKKSLIILDLNMIYILRYNSGLYC